METDISSLTESDGFDLLHRLMAQFSWAGSVTSLGDVIVYAEGDDPRVWTDDQPALTPAMKDVVTSTRTWRRAIADNCAEIGNELAPEWELHPDGSFTVHEDYESVRYTVDGEEQQQQNVYIEPLLTGFPTHGPYPDEVEASEAMDALGLTDEYHKIVIRD